MKKIRVSLRRGAPRADAARRAQLLTAFDRSRLSAAAFAQQHGIHYTTFCSWRKLHNRGQASPSFVQVELAPPTPPSELVIEAGAARSRVVSVAQLPLAARLLQILQEGRPC